jgi:MinD superfamily P-loop ATPase
MPELRQICVISGKGGTGKTTIAASFAALMPAAKVLADCDVDASNLPIVLRARKVESEPFQAGLLAEINTQKCNGCGKCLEVCQFHAVIKRNDIFRIDPLNCEGCKLCAYVCPEGAVELKERLCGECFISETPYGLLVSAELFPAQENSGKLVTHVRDRALELAKERGAEYILIDGAPGTGCPVIATLSGVDLALIVVEPTITGLQALERVYRVAEHFNVKCICCINKWGMNREAGMEIETAAGRLGVPLIGRIPFDRSVIESTVQAVPAVEVVSGSIRKSLTDLWIRLQDCL